jgi:beta-lactamase class A
MKHTGLRLVLLLLAGTLLHRTASPVPARAQLATDSFPAPAGPAEIRIHAADHDTALAGLARTIRTIAARAGGSVGVAAMHFERGEGVSLRGRERFPMASVYKIPIALQLLDRVGCGALSLDDPVHLTPADYRTGSGWITARHRRLNHLTVEDLLVAMLVDSDNTASDYLMRLAGGPAAVSAHLRTLGVPEVRVDRYEAAMALDYAGVNEAPPESTWTIDALWQLKKEVPDAERQASAASFLADPRDTTTPEAMANLLVEVLRGRALGWDDTNRLLEIMSRARTGTARLRGQLPDSTRVAHKTGTWSTAYGITAAVNDVGIITLPGNAGHLVIAVFVKGSNKSHRRIERTIGAIARAAYDYWATLPPPPAKTRS